MAAAVLTWGTATIDDLYKVEGKAELIAGRIVELMATGHLPNLVAGEIYFQLKLYVRQTGKGEAYTDSMGFAIDPPLNSGRQSFSPDVSYYDGPLPANPMRFVDGPPTLAVEVRSENDYGRAAERDIAAKRDDYFQAGTLVVWDVDPLAETVTVYRTSDPTNPIVYRRGDVAEADPAVPGWRLPVDDLYQ